MEGDVLDGVIDAVWGKAVGLYAVVLFVGAAVGLAVAFARAYLRRVMEGIADKLSRLDSLESQLTRLIADMPLHYQRRDEAIREYTAMNAKLDRLWDALIDLRRDRHGS